MKTLSRAITARFFPNPNSYNTLRKCWSDLINSERKHELTAAHHLLYLALIGKDWRKAFTFLTNQRKLDNGAFYGWKMFRALEKIQSKSQEQELLITFDGLITPQMLKELRGLLPTSNMYQYKPSDFINKAFPFDAYSEKNIGNTMVQSKQENSNA